MAKSLVIVESPAKAKTIRKYLGNDYEVKASVGHIMDLPERSMGVDLDSGDFAAEYVPISGKSKVIKEIQTASKKVETVYLAPDPDREGEAIAYHIEQLIKEAFGGKKAANMPQIYRIRFHEITKKAIQNAFLHPEHINLNLFDAQQARRILDRVVGYQISPILWKKVRRGLSAGRVQSVAVRLVSDREKEILAFVPVEYWTLEALADAGKKPEFPVKLLKWDGKKAELTNAEQAHEVKSEIERSAAKILDVQKKKRSRRPGPPFITSRLQQDAARAFRYTAKRTMALAQGLYEGVDLGQEGATGLITYMRTDSTFVSQDAIGQVRGFIVDAYGQSYLPEQPNYFKNKKSAQEAHEAIRPTSMKYTPEFVRPFLKNDMYKLYKLIWERFVASQMSAAEYDQTQIDVGAGRAILRATGSILKFDGFLRAYHEQVDEDDKAALEEIEEEKTRLPDVQVGDGVKLRKVEANQHFTEPPPRFNEASLVKELEEKGIGRPSTYAQILSTVQDKGYVEKRENRFYPTELGTLVTDLLKESFPRIMDVAFTASMESKLDKVEEGEADWKNTLKEFYVPFKASVDDAALSMRNVKRMEEATDLVCEKCGSPMVIKWGKNGSFLGCSNYPTCSNTKPYTRVDGKIIAEKARHTDEKCKECGAAMVVKKGRFGEFLGCSRYPECTYTSPIPIDVKCPKDGGNVLVKRSGRGKVFYGCSNYPTCDFVSWNKPVQAACPHCGNSYIEEKQLKSGTHYQCPACKTRIDELAS